MKRAIVPAAAAAGLLLAAHAFAAAVTFTVASPGRTSAGVFDSGGALVRSLWSNVHYESGTHTASWNGIDDNGVLRPNGPYEIRVLSSNVQYTWEGVVGNTSDSFTGPTLHHPLDIVLGMASSGTAVYFATGYNEQNTSAFRTTTANPQQRTKVLTKGAVTYHVATDGTHVYWSAKDPWIAENSFVYVTRTSDDGEAVLSAAVAKPVTYGRTYTSAIDAVAGTGSTITGLAVQKTGAYLFVTRRGLNRVDVLDKSTGALVRTLTFVLPTALAVDEDNHLWMVTNATTVTKFSVAADGSLAATASISAGIVNALALAVSPDNSTLLVADGGTEQQVKAYDNGAMPAPTLLWTLGQPGGYANGADVANDKFYFRNPNRTTLGIGASGAGADWTFLAYQPDGKLWIGDSANYRSQRFNADRTFLDRIQFIPAFYRADADQNDRARVFANLLEFNVDYSKPLAPDNGSWTLVKNWGWGVPANFLDPHGLLKYPTTLSNGRTYALMRNLSTSRMAVVELPATGGLRFTGFETDGLHYSLHRDGSLRTVSVCPANPIVWKKRELLGFDGSHNPQWGPLTTVATSPLLGMDDVCVQGNPWSLRSWEATSSGIVLAFEEYNSPGWHLQGLDIATGEWKWKAAPGTNAGYVGPYPWDGAFDIGNNDFSEYAGGGQHASGRNIFWQYHGEGWKQGQTNVWTHLHDDGLVVGLFGAVSPGGKRALPEGAAGMAGNAFSSALVEAPDGSLYIYHNDEGQHGGIHRWHVTGLDTIEEETIPIVLDNAFETGLRETWTGDPVRWEGFIQPQFSELYTFHTTASEGMRLWIDGALVIDKWQDPPAAEWSGTLVLDADKLYPITIEHPGSASAPLSWSSASQPKEVVPASRLFYVETATLSSGIDLHDGLPHAATVVDGLYGWHRAPAQDVLNNLFTDWWRVDTNRYSYRRGLPSDVRAHFAQTGTAVLSRDLLAPDAGDADEWSLAGRITYAGEPNQGEYPANNTGGQYLDILDDAGRIIVRMKPRTVAYQTNTSLFGNGSAVVQVDAMTWFTTVAEEPASLRISAAAGAITFTYGDYAPITTGLYDAASNWRRPRTLRLFFWQTGSIAYSRIVDLAEMTFSTAP